MKRFANSLPSSDLNQMIHDPCSKVLIWIKWLWIKLFLIHALKFRSESNDLRPIISDWDSCVSSFQEMIHEPAPKFQYWLKDLHARFEVPIRIKWFTIRTPKSRCKSNYLWYVLQSPDLNQIIRNTQSDCSASKQWFILEHNGLTGNFEKLHFTHHYMLFKIITSDVEIRKWKALLIWFLLVNRVSVWINKSGSSVNDRFVCSSAFCTFSNDYTTLWVLPKSL